MAKRNKKDIVKRSKRTSVNTIHKEITALLIVSFGLLIGVSFFSKAAGLFGEHFRSFCLGLFGYIVLAFPFLLVAYGVHYMIKKGHILNTYKYALTFLLLIFISAGMQLLNYSADYQMSAKERFKFLFEMGKIGKGGGLIGGIIAEPIINMFGVWGAGIILLTMIIVLIILITHVSLFKIAACICRIFTKGFAWMGERIFKGIKNLFYNCRKHTKVAAVDEAITVGLSEQQAEVAAAKEPIIVIDHNTENNLPVSDKSTPVQSTPYPTPKEKKRDEVQDIEPTVPPGLNNEYIGYKFPSIDLLAQTEKIGKQVKSTARLQNNARKLVETLKSFGVEAKVLQVSRGPSITRYELQPSVGVKVSKIVNLADDIALNLAASGVRIEAPIPGKAAIGIEVPNDEVMPVYLREVIESEEFDKFPSKIAFALGKDITGKPVIADIARMPHLLIAGATGSGKSVCINSLITSILYKATPNEVKLLLIDPKVVELGVYNGIPHLLIPVVTDPKKAAGALNWAVQEMIKRYKLFAENNVRDIKGYNTLMPENIMPEILVIIDELADLMMAAPGEVENSVCRLAQMARAAGMHLVIATQRPSVDVITGVIKANIPSRISFAVSSQVDSRTILDMAGAEKLLGKGDMLFYPVGASKPTRLQGAYVSDSEVENIVEYIKANTGANYIEDVIEHIEQGNEAVDFEDGDNDELLPRAIELVVEAEQASISMLQRRLRVGYARAARLIDQMEARGIVGGYEGSKPRQVLITKEQYQEMLMQD